MAKGHTYFWGKPGRRDAERGKFAALMREVEAIRRRHGMSKTALAQELRTSKDVICALDQRKIGRPPRESGEDSGVLQIDQTHAKLGVGLVQACEGSLHNGKVSPWRAAHATHWRRLGGIFRCD